MWVADAVRHAHVPSSSLHLFHRPQQQQTKHRQPAARDQLHDECLNPEVERLNETLRRRVFLQHDDPHDGPFPVPLLDHRQREMVGHADDESRQPHAQYGQLRPLNVAVTLAVVRVAHADVAEDGQRDRQPDGHGVNDDAEAGVEEHEANGRQRVTHWSRFRAVKAVELQREREVGRHREAVRDREPGEDAIRR